MLAERGHSVIICAEEWPESPEGVYHVLPFRTNGVTAFAEAMKRYSQLATDTVLFSLERTPRQDIYRAGDGVHAAWLERRTPYITSWKRFFASFDLKHHSLLQLEKQVFSSKNTSVVIANSDMVRGEIVQRFQYPADQIRVIHPGVDLKYFTPCPDSGRKRELRKQLGLPPEVVVWSFVGSGFARKGLRWAIELAAAQTLPPTLCVLGKGSVSMYRALGAKHKLPLQFLPLETEARDVYQASDAFILPTIYDPCSNACLEAAACGLPVITTTANGASERVQGLFLSDPGDIERFAPRCNEYNVPLNLSGVGEMRRADLDENPCWEALLQLIHAVALNKEVSKQS